MSDDANVNVAITAKFQNLIDGLGKSSNAVKQTTTEMRSQFQGLTQAVELVGGAFGTLVAVIAGGAVFRAAVDVVTHGVEEVRMFAMQLGMGTERASGFKDAIEDSGGSVSAMESSLNKLSLQLRTNEKGLQELGLKTRDASGHLRTADDLFFDAVAVMKQYKQGTDQNVVANTLFGRSVRDVRELMRVQKSDVEQSIADMKALGLIVGEEDVEANYRFIKASGDAQDVMDGLGKVIGQAVLPILSQLGEWFSQAGPTMVSVFRVAIAALFTPFYGLIGLAREMKGAMDIVFGSLGQMISRTTEAFIQAAHGDFAGAWKTIKDGGKDADAAVGKSLQQMSDDAIKTAKELSRLWDPQTTSVEPDGGGKSAPSGDKTTAGTQFDILRAKLEQWKEEQPSLLADLSAQEAAYWRNALAQSVGNAELMRKIKHEIYTLDVAEAKRSLSEQLAALGQQSVMAKDHYALRVSFAVEAANKIGAAYGMESAEYRKALTEIAQLASAERERQLRNAQEEVELRAQHNTTLLGIEESHINTMHALHQTSDTEQVSQLAALHEKEYQIELAALNEKLAMLDTWSDAYGSTLDAIAKLEDQHTVQVAKNNDELLASQAKTIEGYLSPITSAIEQSVTGIAQGTTTMRKAVQGVLQSIEAQFISMVAKRIVHWAAGELAMTTATTVGTASRTGIEASASGVSLAMKAAGIIRKIMAYAAETFGGVFAFLSGTMGPAAAGPAAASSAAVAAVAGGIGLSAAGGYDIPAGVNPMVQTHAREMILPAKLADPLRDMLAGGDAPGKTEIHVHAVDAKSVRDLFTQHGSALVDALKRQARGFGTA